MRVLTHAQTILTSGCSASRVGHALMRFWTWSRLETCCRCSSLALTVLCTWARKGKVLSLQGITELLTASWFWPHSLLIPTRRSLRITSGMHSAAFAAMNDEACASGGTTGGCSSGTVLRVYAGEHLLAVLRVLKYLNTAQYRELVFKGCLLHTHAGSGSHASYCDSDLATDWTH